MEIRRRTPFTTIRVEGSILPPDLLQRISEGDKEIEGLSPSQYHLIEGEKLNEAINRSWNRLVVVWRKFQEERDSLSEGDLGIKLTRERFLLPLFQELGYGRLISAKTIEIEDKSYPVSHDWLHTPIHLVGCGMELDKRISPLTPFNQSISPLTPLNQSISVLQYILC